MPKYRNEGIPGIQAAKNKLPDNTEAIVFGLCLLLLGLDDLDDISKVLKLHLILGANYWFVMEPIYAIGSGILFLTFGKILMDISK